MSLTRPLKIVILSRSKEIPSTRRLYDAARGKGHLARVLDPTQLELHLGSKGAHLFRAGKRLPRPDVVIPRIAASVSTYGLAVVSHYALLDVVLMNDAQGIAQARNKMRALQRLSAQGIDVPATVMARDTSHLEERVGRVGGLPVVVKLVQGQGKPSVMICESMVSLRAALDAALGLGQNLVLQRYVRSKGLDLRVMVVGGEAVAAVRRTPRVGRLSTTLQTGARLRQVPLEQRMGQVAVEAARLVGLEVAAVDLLEARGRLEVFDINSSPALTEMEAATGVDLAGRIIDRAEALAARAPPARSQGEEKRGASGRDMRQMK